MNIKKEEFEFLKLFGGILIPFIVVCSFGYNILLLHCYNISDISFSNITEVVLSTGSSLWFTTLVTLIYVFYDIVGVYTGPLNFKSWSPIIVFLFMYIFYGGTDNLYMSIALIAAAFLRWFLLKSHQKIRDYVQVSSMRYALLLFLILFPILLFTSLVSEFNKINYSKSRIVEIQYATDYKTTYTIDTLRIIGTSNNHTYFKEINSNQIIRLNQNDIKMIKFGIVE
ncbi:MAG: hypothetical protein RL204_2213 [Bacteroidota bacterium]|jgi:hypothetical protein